MRGDIQAVWVNDSDLLVNGLVQRRTFDVVQGGPNEVAYLQILYLLEANVEDVVRARMDRHLEFKVAQLKVIPLVILQVHTSLLRLHDV